MQAKTQALDKPGILDNMGLIFQVLNRKDSALICHNLSLELAKEKYNSIAQISANLHLGMFYRGKDSVLSSQYMNESLRIADSLSKNGKLEQKEVLEDLYNEVSDKMVAVGDFERAYIPLMALSDINKYRSENAIKALGLEQRKLERELLTQLRLKSYFGIAVSVLGFLFLFSSFLGIRQKNRVLIAEKDMNTLLNEQEKRTTTAVEEAREISRKEIARDIHDQLGGDLSTAKFLFDGLTGDIQINKEPEPQQFEKIAEVLDSAIARARKVAHKLNSRMLSEFDLVLSIKDLGKTLESSKKIKVHCYIDGLENDLGVKRSREVFGIVKELSTNVLKHAKASELIIQLQTLKKDGLLNLMIQDDGQGFEPSVAEGKTSTGMGIQSIKNQVEGWEGTFTIDSTKNQGTTIFIDIPYTNLDAVKA